MRGMLGRIEVGVRSYVPHSNKKDKKRDHQKEYMECSESHLIFPHQPDEKKRIQEDEQRVDA